MRKTLASLLLLVAGCCAALAVAEALVRVFAPHSRDHVVPGGLFKTDTTLGWTLNPGRTLRHRTRYFDVNYDINSMGFRDPARETGTPVASLRVLLFGDSQIFGWGVPAGSRLSDLTAANVRGAQLWNMGVPGYGLDQQVLAYATRGGSLQAHAVVFYVSGSGIERTRHSRMFNKPKPRFVAASGDSLILMPVGSTSPALTAIAYGALSPFYLPYFLERAWGNLKGNRRPSADPSGASGRSARIIGALPLALLSKADNIARARGQRIAVISDLPPRATVQLREFCKLHGMEFVAVPFAEGTPGFVLGPEDPHWNAQGHALIGSGLTAIVNDWLQDDSARVADIRFR